MARRKTGNVLSADVDEARSQILMAAQSVFLRYGVNKTTMDDIARESGVSRPTVYRYFRDRDSLISALIEMRSRILFGRAREFVQSQPTFEDVIVEGLIFLIDNGRRDPIVRILVSPERMEMTTALVGSSDLAARLTREMWEPILMEAQQRGDVRTDVTIDEINEWFALLQFILVGRLDFVHADDPSHRKLIRTFVMPSLRP
jgi:AcrR family transcriptional regulator